MYLEPVYKTYYQSPIGIIEIVCTDKNILSVNFIDDINSYINTYENSCIAYAEECIKQLHEYFAGKRKNFTLDIKLNGTDFQKKVWSALTEIPYGETVSYGKIAEKIGNKKAARAVGNANNRNPISIIVPCHRVIGSDGNLTGYGGGLWRKKWLLEHEKSNR
ncbi:MAG: methylated-DNA--[protein]-cysteine S-methyltransferase [Firmicutes bacterium]|nr:methylated-DNA--[protein]-cysteine S-methyltransferase [Bacillota bacterium]